MGGKWRSISLTLSHMQTPYIIFSAEYVILNKLWGKEKLLMMSNFPFCHSVSTLLNNYAEMFRNFALLFSNAYATDTGLREISPFVTMFSKSLLLQMRLSASAYYK